MPRDTVVSPFTISQKRFQATDTHCSILFCLFIFIVGFLEKSFIKYIETIRWKRSDGNDPMETIRWKRSDSSKSGSELIQNS